MYQTDFTPDEFRARRQKLCELIGPEAHALVPGSPGPKGGGLFHQYKDFYYLSGLETPRGYLLIEGRTGRTTAYLPHESQADLTPGPPTHGDAESDLLSVAHGPSIHPESLKTEELTVLRALSTLLFSKQFLYNEAHRKPNAD